MNQIMRTNRLSSNVIIYLSAFLLVLLLNSTSSVAQEDQAVSQAQLTLEFKSEATALKWSLLGTLIPISAGAVVALTSDGKQSPEVPLILSTTGVTFGPSLGYFYGGRSSRGAQGILIRVGTEALIGAFVLISEVSSTSGGEWLQGGPAEQKMEKGSIAILVIGGVVVIADAVYDIYKVKGEVQKYNQSLQKINLQLVPKFFAESKALSLQVGITF